jgi:hypothetical protein
MAVSAILFLLNRFVALGLTPLGPVLVNILLFHLFMLPKTRRRLRGSSRPSWIVNSRAR